MDSIITLPVAEMVSQVGGNGGSTPEPVENPFAMLQKPAAQPKTKASSKKQVEGVVGHIDGGIVYLGLDLFHNAGTPNNNSDMVYAARVAGESRWKPVGLREIPGLENIPEGINIKLVITRHKVAGE